MSNSTMDDKVLRKAWLKKKFGSFEYHDDLVRVHEQWRNVLRKALARAEQDTRPNRPDSGYKTIADEARNFRATTMPIIEKKPKPGDYKREQWEHYYATGLFRSIPDYNRYLISEGDMLQWMTPEESAELNKYWGPMTRMAENIKYTVDDYWFNPRKGNDDILLEEAYTGPIDWPANWRDDVSDRNVGSDPHLRCEAGQPCPREGFWFTPAKAGSRRHFSQGETMPDFKTDWGTVVWQWSQDK